jgi:cobalt-zinc-cadmium efflux system membrane fusion protein
MKMLLAGTVTASLALLGACDSKSGEGAAQATSADACPHEIKAEKCPFCNPGLVESEGFCGEHGVAEALCAQCRPYLKAAFRTKGDWCEEHKLPESQCVECNPELKENVRPGEHGVAATGNVAGACPHGIDGAKCPFCTPSLIDSEGFCDGHGVAEALCVKCRPYLETAFKAAGDWCAEHATPESQCAECNPELKDGGEG